MSINSKVQSQLTGTRRNRLALLAGTAMSAGVLLGASDALAACSYGNNLASYSITGICNTPVTVSTNVNSSLTADNSVLFAAAPGIGLWVKPTGTSAVTLNYSDSSATMIVGGGARLAGTVGNGALVFGGDSFGLPVATNEALNVTVNGNYAAKPTGSLSNDPGVISIYGGTGAISVTLTGSSIVNEVGTGGSLSKMAGVGVQGGSGAVTLQAQGLITSDNAGIYAATTSSSGSLLVGNSGRIEAGGDGMTTGLLNAGTVNFGNSGQIRAGGSGIYALSLTNDVTIDGSGGQIGALGNPTGKTGIFAATLAAGKNVLIKDTGTIFSGSGAPSNVPAISIPGLASFAPFSGGAVAISLLGSAQIGQQSGPGATNLQGDTITTTGNYGLAAIGIGGSASVFGSGSTIVANSGMGILAIGVNGDATVESGKVNSGSGGGLTIGALIPGFTIPAINGGVAAISVTGTAKVTASGDTTTTGNFGIFAAGIGGAANVTTTGTTVNAANGNGIFALAGVGDATVNAGTTITGAGPAITLPAIGGFTLPGLSGGILAASLAGNASITAAGDTTTGGNFGAFALGGVAATVTTTGTTVTASSGNGIEALALAGDATVNAGTTKSGAGPSIVIPAILGVTPPPLNGGILALSLGGNGNVTAAGDTSTDGNFGIFALGGLGATVTSTGTTVTANNGTGVVAIGIGGDAVVKTGAVNSGNGPGFDIPSFLGITIPTINGGVVAASLTGKADVTASGDTMTTGNYGVFALGLGTGASVTTTGTTVTANSGTGIVALAGAGDATVNAGTTVSGAGPAITLPAIAGISLAPLNGGLVAASLGGSANVMAAGDTTTGGNYGVFAAGIGGGAMVTTTGTTVTANNGMGILALGGVNDATVNAGTTMSGNGGGLTLPTVLGITIPTVNGGIGALSLGGSANVTTAGDTTTSGNFGVFAAGLGGGATATTTGTTVTAKSGTGIVALAGVGDATVNAGTTVSGAGAAITMPSIAGITLAPLNGGILAASIGGSANVTTAGDTTTDGNYGVFAAGLAGGATVTTTGTTVTANNGTGIFALAGGGDANVKSGAVTSGNGGGLTIPSFLGITFPTIGGGIVAGSLTGATSVVASGDVTTTGNFGVFAAALQGVTVDTTASTLSATNGTGIFALGKSVDIKSAAVTAGNTGPSIGPVTLSGGIVGIAYDGATNITNSGKISSTGTFGILGAAINGDTTINVNAAIDPPLIGALAFNINGTSNVNVNAPIQATLLGAGAINLGTGDVNVIVAANSPIQSDGFGIGVLKLGDGKTTIDVSSAISGLTGAQTVNGVTVLNVGNGDIAIDTRKGGTIEASNDGIAVAKSGDGAIGVTVRDTINAGQVGVEVNKLFGQGDINVQVRQRSAVTSANGNGIQIHEAGEGDVGVVVGRRSSVTADNGSAISIVTGSLITDNNVQVTNRGRLSGQGGLLSPTVGVLADGNVQIDNDRGLITTGTGLRTNLIVGIGAGGTATVNNRGRMIGDVGILAGGDVVVNNYRRWETDGLNTLTSTNGSTTIYNTGRIDAGPFDVFTMVSNTGNTIWNDLGGRFNAVGVNTIGMAAANGDNLIRNSDGSRFDLIGANTIGMAADTGNNVFQNTTKSTFNVDGVTNVGMLVNNGNNLVENSGGAVFNATGLTKFGMATKTGSNTFNNSATFNSAGTTEFIMGAPGDKNVVNNSGVINVTGDPPVLPATGLMRFDGGLGLQFNNTGLVDMRNGLPKTFGGATDLVYVSGSFNGLAGSRLGVDAFLGAPGSTADRLGVGANVTGLTNILVNDTNKGPGAYNPVGITVVGINGTGGAGNFQLAPGSSGYDPRFGGVLDKGLFFYYLDNDPTASSTGCKTSVDGGAAKHCVALYSAPDASARQLPMIVTGAINTWYDTALLWEDRQTEIRALVNGRPAMVTADLPTRKAPVMAPPPVFSTGTVWAKAIGSWMNRSNYQTSVGMGGKPFGFDLGYKQDSYGIVGGVDYGKQAIFGPTDVVLAGVMGGYVESTLSFKNGGGTQYKYKGATVGGSLSYLNNGFFADALLKADLLTIDVGIPALSTFGFRSAPINATTLGFLANLGYRWDAGGPLFIEPVATLAYASVKVDNLNMPLLGAQATFGNGESFRGALGARVGATWGNWLDHSVQASLTARVWDEFRGRSNNATLLNPGLPITMNDNFGGVFGEVKGGIDLISIGPGWGAFANAGVKFNNRFTTVTGKGGVTYAW